MINTLFSMHNIKYIISVDDCFFARKREDIEATIYSEMCTSLEPFRAILSSCNQTEIVDAIDEMMTVGADSTTLIQTLLGNLEEVDLLKCFDICEKNSYICRRTRYHSGIPRRFEIRRTNYRISNFFVNNGGKPV